MVSLQPRSNTRAHRARMSTLRSATNISLAPRAYDPRVSMNSQASCTRQAQARIRAPKPGQICFDSIEDWEAATSWDDILLPFDFEYRGMTSQVAIQYLRAGGGGERSLIAYDEPG